MKGTIKAGDSIDVRIYRFSNYKEHHEVNEAWIPAFVREAEEGSRFLAWIPESGDLRWYPWDSKDWRLPK